MLSMSAAACPSTDWHGLLIHTAHSLHREGTTTFKETNRRFLIINNISMILALSSPTTCNSVFSICLCKNTLVFLIFICEGRRNKWGVTDEGWRLCNSLCHTWKFILSSVHLLREIEFTNCFCEIDSVPILQWKWSETLRSFTITFQNRDN